MVKIDHDEDGIAQLVDAHAEALLLECGLLGNFRRTDEHITQVVIYNDHPSYFLLAELYSGKANPADNGYGVLCFSKSHFDQAAFLKIANDYLASSGQKAIEVRQLDQTPPTN